MHIKFTQIQTSCTLNLMRALNLQKTTNLIDVFNHLKISAFLKDLKIYLINPLSLNKPSFFLLCVTRCKTRNKVFNRSQKTYIIRFGW